MISTRTARGFTYIEVAIILMVLAILAGILLPNIGNFNSLARKVRLKEDLGVLCVSLKMMLDDLGDNAFFSSGYAATASYRTASYGGASSYSSAGGGSWSVDSRTQYAVQAAAQADHAAHGSDEWCENCNMPLSQCGPDCMDDCNEECLRNQRERMASVTTQTWRYDGSQAAIGRTGVSVASSSGYSVGGRGGYIGAPIGLVVGNGDVPASAIGATRWQLPIGTLFTETTAGYFPTHMSFVVDTFDDLLIHRDPAYSGYASVGSFGYGRGVGGYGLPGTSFRWRGPYIADRVTSDPWGNRYMANVFGLHAPPLGLNAGYNGINGRYVETFQSAVVCYSAGANETIETGFNQPYGWYTGGDDVTAVLAGAGGMH